MRDNAFKRIGHAAEELFNRTFGDAGARISYTKRIPDCLVTQDRHRKELSRLNPTGFSVSLKAGRTWQIHLGKIDELTDFGIWSGSYGKVARPGKKAASCGKHGRTWGEQLAVLTSCNFWNKYFRKGDLLCYYDKTSLWTFFNFDHVIRFITTSAKWRLVDTGRIKGDFTNADGDSVTGVITYEYRAESHKKTFVLGAHGGVGPAASGYRLFCLLKNHIPWVSFCSANNLYESGNVG